MKKLVAICGKAASGKDTIVSRLVEWYPDYFNKKIAYTTRDPRPGEIDGVNYHFKTNEEFFNLIVENKIYEATDFNGAVYGTGVDSLKDDVVNIGIFDPVGLDALINEKDIDMIVFYIDLDDNTRIIRMLQDSREETIDEIYNRYKFDREIFDGIEDFPNIVIVPNNEETIDKAVLFIKHTATEFF